MWMVVVVGAMLAATECEADMTSSVLIAGSESTYVTSPLKGVPMVDMDENNCTKCPDLEYENLVCGTDGVMYSSLCHVHYMACLGKNVSILNQASQFGCQNKIKKNVCDFICLRMDYPVCASNGVTYPSLCHLEREIYCSHENLRGDLAFVKKDPCEPDNINICEKECQETNYVCGTDGVTYRSPCEITKIRVCHRRKVYEAHLGNCRLKCERTCPPVKEPVCGSNGFNYANLCILRAHTCRGVPVRHLYGGACKRTFDCEDRTCPEEGDHVCGSNGVTYTSLCQLKLAAQCSQVIVYKLHDGDCLSGDTLNANKCDKICPDTAHPVCGTDGKTYRNLCCLLESSDCEDRQVDVMHVGNCVRHYNTPIRCPPPVSPNIVNCTSRRDTCFSCRDCALKGTQCCYDGCSFHCTESMNF